MFRFVDPVSTRTLALRHDMTGQVGRIAVTRLAEQPRPLRLAYGGPVVRVKGSQLFPERESIQAGAELIGSDGVAAACEVLGVAIEALEAVGATDLAIDVTLPDVVETLAGLVLPPARVAELKRLLDMKDAGGLMAADFGDWLPLLAATGSAETALAALRGFDHVGLLASRLDGVAAIVAAVGGRARVTLDPTELHGFEFQSWLGFSIFAGGVRGEAGRGGAYAVTRPDGGQRAGGRRVALRRWARGRRPWVRPRGAGCCSPPAPLPEASARASAPRAGPRSRRLGGETPATLRCTHVWNGVEASPV